MTAPDIIRDINEIVKFFEHYKCRCGKPDYSNKKTSVFDCKKNKIGYLEFNKNSSDVKLVVEAQPEPFTYKECSE